MRLGHDAVHNSQLQVQSSGAEGSDALGNCLHAKARFKNHRYHQKSVPVGHRGLTMRDLWSRAKAGLFAHPMTELAGELTHATQRLCLTSVLSFRHIPGCMAIFGAGPREMKP
jgi:hypothetical protein